MTHRIGYRPEARAELSDIADWYEGQRRGLGESFLAAFEETLRRISEWPLSAPSVSDLPGDPPVRSAALRRYPYRVVYLIQDDAIRVLAVAHTSRRPGYWQGRVGLRRVTESNPPQE